MRGKIPANTMKKREHFKIGRIRLDSDGNCRWLEEERAKYNAEASTAQGWPLLGWTFSAA
jgi:hypothetical protein